MEHTIRIRDTGIRATEVLELLAAGNSQIGRAHV